MSKIVFQNNHFFLIGELHKTFFLNQNLRVVTQKQSVVKHGQTISEGKFNFSSFSKNNILALKKVF